MKRQRPTQPPLPDARQPHSFEEDRLCWRPSRVAKVAQPDAHEPKPLLLPEIDTRSQLQRYRRQFLAR